MTQDKPKVFLVGGFPGSGKTTLTKFSDGYLNADVISLDDIHIDMLRRGFLWRNDERIAEAAHGAAMSSLRSGRNVVLDSVYTDKNSRREALRAFDGVADVYMITMDVPMEICRQRNSRRAKPVEDWVYDRLSETAVEADMSEGFAGTYKFCNLTPAEEAEVKAGRYDEQPEMSVDYKERAVRKTKAFLRKVAEETGIMKERELPDVNVRSTDGLFEDEDWYGCG